MMKFVRKQLLWLFYAVVVVVALAFGQDDTSNLPSSGLTAGNIFVWVLLFCFLAYSLYCTSKESFLRVLPKINQYHWGRQIGIDLYISMLLSMILIYLVEGSFLILALWFIPVLIFANLAFLLYLAINYHSVMALFAQ